MIYGSNEPDTGISISVGAGVSVADCVGERSGVWVGLGTGVTGVEEGSGAPTWSSD